MGAILRNKPFMGSLNTSQTTFLVSYLSTHCPHDKKARKREKAARSHFIPLLFLPARLLIVMPAHFKHASFAGSKAIEKDHIYSIYLYILLCFGRAEKRCEEGATQSDEERKTRNEARRKIMMVLYQKAIYLSQRSLPVEEGDSSIKHP